MSSSPSDARTLRILFSMRNYWYVRHFEPVIRELGARGHAVHLLAERAVNEQANDWAEAAEALAREVPGLTFDTAPRADEDAWYDLRVILRLGLDYVRFTTPQYRGLTQLVARARDRTPSWLRRLAESGIGRSAGGRAVITGLLASAERVLPSDPALAAYISGQRPDLVIVTPLVEFGSEQVDVVRVARQLGTPSVLAVGSWDHLSSKGLLRALPDRVLVWNDTQRQEATEMHGVPADRIVVTGAQVFDAWFDRRPALDRAAFCARVGLDPQQPFVLYTCSALFEGSPSEVELLARWIAAVRRHPDLSRTGVLVRPHPKRAAELADLDLGSQPNVAVWPPIATAPISRESKDDYFDSLYHAGAVVGLNTSALIEGGIVGRPVLTLLDPAYAGNQEGTLHFRYLLEGGLLRAARTMDAHVADLAEALREDTSGRRNEAFVRAFVRPRGLGQPATGHVVAALESAATIARDAARPGLADRAARVLLWPIARATSGRFAEQVARARRRRIEDEDRVRRLAAAAAERLRIREARDAGRRAERVAKEEAKAARIAAQTAERERARQAKEAAAAQARADAERERLEKESREREAKERQREARLKEKAERLARHRRDKRASTMKNAS
jgi:hypothetical protein